MPPLEQRIKELENRLAQLEKIDRFTIYKLMQITDGKNIQLGKTIGTKIGTETAQKLGFYNATPVDQPDTISDPSGQTNDLDSEARTAINALIDRLQELGLIA